MEKNKKEYNKSSERYKTCLHHFVYCKSNQPCIHKCDIYWRDKEKLENINSRCSSNELAFNLCNSFLSSIYNNVRTNFVKSVGIYQLFILQFAVTTAEEESSGASNGDTLKLIQEKVIGIAKTFWGKYTECLCNICCNNNGFINKETCKLYIPIPVMVFLFLFVLGIICLICCKCCCKKSCCKKKENDESDVDCNQFIMGPDGQMYSQMYQGQMMQPQMIPAGMMYPQMYPGQMYYPQMLQQGMQQPQMQYMEMQHPQMQYMEMQQPEMQYMEVQQPEMQHM
ncbi:unnamed protein product [Plasmodium vivax]|uniref:(malaria parasite P. vivax) hypothetical protein n=1 Tax=Plasmodium vivax TaxID=5855 RepID=A0A8S4HAQ6_PLAVI|nr:unnamed protein product [Plasmodium vivax]